MRNDAISPVDAYLKHVTSGLRGLPKTEVLEILRELRAHILERTAFSHRPGSGTGPLQHESIGMLDLPHRTSCQMADSDRDAEVSAVLQRLGSPDEVASQYLAEWTPRQIETRISPLRAVKEFLQWTAVSIVGSLVCLTSCVGYAAAAVFLYCGIAKIFSPGQVGLWVRGGESVSLGTWDPKVTGNEVLGWWMVPLGLLLGIGILFLVTRLGFWVVKRLPASMVPVRDLGVGAVARFKQRAMWNH